MLINISNNKISILLKVERECLNIFFEYIHIQYIKYGKAKIEKYTNTNSM